MDPYGKVRGGDTGWHHMASKSLPKAVVDAAFSSGVGEVSQPITTDAGIYLISVSAIEPPPNDATLKFRMRQAFAVELRRKIIDEANIEFVGTGAGR